MRPIIPAEHAEAFEIIPGMADAGILLICDHAQATIPPEYAALGLPPEQLSRHIAYDIGAERVTRGLAAAWNCPAVMSRFSRLLIDPNRGLDDPTLVMRIADGAIVPGNARIDRAEIEARIERFYRPYDDAIARVLGQMEASVTPPVLVSMHSYTPIMKDVARPWHITVIWDFDPRLNRAVLDVLSRESDLVVGENEPYQGGFRGDTLDRHVLRTGIAHVLIEIRQNEIDTDQKADFWAARLGALLPPLLKTPEMRERKVFGAHI